MIWYGEGITKFIAGCAEEVMEMTSSIIMRIKIVVGQASMQQIT